MKQERERLRRCAFKCKKCKKCWWDEFFSNYACHPCALSVENRALEHEQSACVARSRRRCSSVWVLNSRGHANLLCIVPSLTDAPEGVQKNAAILLLHKPSERKTQKEESLPCATSHSPSHPSSRLVHLLRKKRQPEFVEPTKRGGRVVLFRLIVGCSAPQTPPSNCPFATAPRPRRDSQRLRLPPTWCGARVTPR